MVVLPCDEALALAPVWTEDDPWDVLLTLAWLETLLVFLVVDGTEGN